MQILYRVHCILSYLITIKHIFHASGSKCPYFGQVAGYLQRTALGLMRAAQVSPELFWEKVVGLLHQYLARMVAQVSVANTT